MKIAVTFGSYAFSADGESVTLQKELDRFYEQVAVAINAEMKKQATAETGH